VKLCQLRNRRRRQQIRPCWMHRGCFDHNGECVPELIKLTDRTRDGENTPRLQMAELKRCLTDSLTDWLNRTHKTTPGNRWREISKCSGNHSEMIDGFPTSQKHEAQIASWPSINHCTLYYPSARDKPLRRQKQTLSTGGITPLDKLTLKTYLSGLLGSHCPGPGILTRMNTI
jgi:hypothetical protein